MALKVYSFCCDAGHLFEGWLRTETDWQEEAQAGRLTCPICGSSRLEKRIDAPNFKAVQGTVRTDVEKDAAQRRNAEAVQAAEAAQAAAMRTLRELAGKAEYVGKRFPDEVRAMHDGSAQARLVKGECSTEEAVKLAEEGCPVMPIPDFAQSDN